MRRAAVRPQYRGHLNVPISRIPLRGIGRALEPPGSARLRCLNRAQGVGTSLTGPKVRPWTALELAEVLDLHDPLAAFTHELQAALQVEDFDAVSAASQHAPQNLIIACEAGSGRGQFSVQR